MNTEQREYAFIEFFNKKWNEHTSAVRSQCGAAFEMGIWRRVVGSIYWQIQLQVYNTVELALKLELAK